MPKNRSIQASQLTVGALALVRGNIQFCRLTHRIEGEELAQGDAQREKRGQIAVGKPYTTVTLSNPHVVPLNANGQLTPEEKYLEESFYTTSATNELRYTVINKSPYENRFYQNNGGDPKTGDEFVPTGELANGLDVMLIMKVYKSKSYNNKTLGLDGIIVEEPVRYWSGSNQNAMAEAGIVVNQMSDADRKAARGQTDDDDASNVPPVTENDDSEADSFSSAMNAPESDEETSWVCPQCGATNAGKMKFCGECGAKRPEGSNANPYASSPQGGIRFNSDDSRKY